MALRKLTAEEIQRVCRRPLPRTVREWHAELLGVSNFAAQRPKLIEGNGAKWFRSLQDYYRLRAIYLAHNPPGTMTRKAAQAAVAPIVALLK